MDSKGPLIIVIWQKSYLMIFGDDKQIIRERYHEYESQIQVTIGVDPPIKLKPPKEPNRGHIVAVFHYGANGDLLEAKSIAGDL